MINQESLKYIENFKYLFFINIILSFIGLFLAYLELLVEKNIKKNINFL